LWLQFFNFLLIHFYIFIADLLYFHSVSMIFRCMRTLIAFLKWSTIKCLAIFNSNVSFKKYFFKMARIMAFFTAIIAVCHFFIKFDINVFLYGNSLLHCLPRQFDWGLKSWKLECLFDFFYVFHNFNIQSLHLLKFIDFMLFLKNQLDDCLLFAIQVQ